MQKYILNKIISATKHQNALKKCFSKKPCENDDDDEVTADCDENKHWHNVTINWLDKVKGTQECAGIHNVASFLENATKIEFEKLIVVSISEY